MKLAITYENGEIFGHFGHTEQFKIYEISDGKVTKMEILDANGQGHGALAGLLQNNGVEMLICGGIGGGAKHALADAGIRVFAGVSGKADDAAEAFLNDTLLYSENVTCGGQEGGHGHCGSGSCKTH